MSAPLLPRCPKVSISSHNIQQVLRHFELRPVLVGLIFGLKDGANSIASPIWGILCDKNRYGERTSEFEFYEDVFEGCFFQASDGEAIHGGKLCHRSGILLPSRGLKRGRNQPDLVS